MMSSSSMNRSVPEDYSSLDEAELHALLSDIACRTRTQEGRQAFDAPSSSSFASLCLLASDAAWFDSSVGDLAIRSVGNLCSMAPAYAAAATAASPALPQALARTLSHAHTPSHRRSAAGAIANLCSASAETASLVMSSAMVEVVLDAVSDVEAAKGDVCKFACMALENASHSALVCDATLQRAPTLTASALQPNAASAAEALSMLASVLQSAAATNATSRQRALRCIIEALVSCDTFDVSSLAPLVRKQRSVEDIAASDVLPLMLDSFCSSTSSTSMGVLLSHWVSSERLGLQVLPRLSSLAALLRSCSRSHVQRCKIGLQIVANVASTARCSAALLSGQRELLRWLCEESARRDSDSALLPLCVFIVRNLALSLSADAEPVLVELGAEIVLHRALQLTHADSSETLSTQHGHGRANLQASALAALRHLAEAVTATNDVVELLFSIFDATPSRDLSSTETSGPNVVIRFESARCLTAFALRSPAVLPLVLRHRLFIALVTTMLSCSHDLLTMEILSLLSVGCERSPLDMKEVGGELRSLLTRLRQERELSGAVADALRPVELLLDKCLE